MDQRPEVKAVTPKPALPKTIGAFNLVFGCVFFLCGLGCLHEFAPSLTQYQPLRFEPEEAQVVYDQFRRTMIDELEAQEKAAPSAAEKARLKKERQALQVGQPKIQEVIDLKEINRDLLWLSWYFWADIVTGPFLNLLMLASGIGLLQLRGWARTMGLWVAALKLGRLVALSLFLLLGVIPHLTRSMEVLVSTDLGRAMLAKASADQNRKSGLPATAAVDPKQIVPALNFLGDLTAIGYLAFGSIYPAIALAVLSRPSAKAACADTTDGEPDEATEESW